MKTLLLCAALTLTATARGEGLDETIHITTLKELPALTSRLEKDLPEDAAGAVQEIGKRGQVAYIDIWIDGKDGAGRFQPWRES